MRFTSSTHNPNQPSVAVPQHEWEQLQESLQSKEKALSERDATIAEQTQQLGVLDSMRSLVASFPQFNQIHLKLILICSTAIISFGSRSAEHIWKFPEQPNASFGTSSQVQQFANA